MPLCWRHAGSSTHEMVRPLSASRPSEWLADGQMTCNVQCLKGHCDRRVDVRLDTLPRDQHWSRVGCAWCARHVALQDLCILSRTGTTVPGKSGRAWGQGFDSAMKQHPCCSV